MLKRKANHEDVFEQLLEQLEKSDADAGIGEDVGQPASDDAALSDGEDSPAEPNQDAQSADTESGADADTAPEDNTAEVAPPRSRLRRVRRRLAVVTAALVFAAALGLSGFLYWQVKQRDDTVSAGAAALETAKSFAVTLTTIDTANVDQNFTQVLDGSTAEFKGMYSQSSAQLRQLLLDNKAESHGTVIDAGVKSATKNQVEVLLFVDQAISNAVTPEPRLDRLRIAMTMDHIDGRWLASHVEIK